MEYIENGAGMTYTMMFRKKFVSGNLDGLEITEAIDFATDRAARSWMAGCDINIVRNVLDWKFASLNNGAPARYVVMHENASKEYLTGIFEAWLKENTTQGEYHE